MSTQTKRRRDVKTWGVRILCLCLAALMVMSVVLAAVWRW